MGASTWVPGVSPDRRMAPDRRVAHSILCQESLARIVAETRGADSHAGRALKELAFRRACAAELATGEDELIIYSLRGQWLVGPVHEIREAMLAAAAASCRRRTGAAAAAPESGVAPQRQAQTQPAGQTR